LHKTAQTHTKDFKINMQKISYCDLHCDTVTKCLDAGANFFNGNLHSSIKNLTLSGATAQCFAIFTEGANAKDYFFKCLKFYSEQIIKNERYLAPVTNFSEYKTARKNKKIACVLTVENLGFIGEDLSLINRLKKLGVCMASLVWNNKNSLASPNLVCENGKANPFKRCNAGLTDLGKSAIKALCENKIIIDISHLSDGGVNEILSSVRLPVVASHSNAFSVRRVSRNLQDSQIKKIADLGGVVGVNFCRAFLGKGDAFNAILKHINHLILVGGEEVVAFGSDFDGITAPKKLQSAKKMPNLLSFLRKRLPARVCEKLFYKNFERVFKEVRG